MSETITDVVESGQQTEVTTIIAESQPTTEVVGKLWERDDLTPLVMAHAERIVLVGGVETTLGAAITTYMIENTVSEHTQDAAIAYVHQLLASEPLKKEKPPEEDKTIEDGVTPKEEAEQKVEDNFAESAVAEDTPDTEVNKPIPAQETQQTEAIVETSGKVSSLNAEALGDYYDSATEDASLSETVVPQVQVQSAQPNKQPSNFEAVPKDTITSPEPGVPDKSRGTVMPTEVQNVLHGPSSNILQVETISKTNAIKSASENDSIRLSAESETAAKTIDYGPAHQILPDELEKTAEPAPVISDEIEPVQSEIAELSTEPTTGHFELMEFSEDEIVIIDHSEAVMPDDLPVESSDYYTEIENAEFVADVSYGSGAIEQLEIDIEEDSTIGFPAKEAEDRLATVDELLGSIETENTEQLRQVLAGIIELAAKTIDQRGEEIEQAESEEEVRVLLIELLDHAGVDYTPELIETLVRAVLQHYLQMPEVEVANETLSESGTHEAIIKPVLAINNIKKTMARAYQIGKSTLDLYVRAASGQIT